MDKKSLDEFFAQAEDVLTNWPGSRDAADTEDPGYYDLDCGSEDEHDLMAMVPFSHLDSVSEDEWSMVEYEVTFVGIDLAGADSVPFVMCRDSDGVIRLVNAEPITIPTGERLSISSGTICLSLSDGRDENIDNPD